MLTIKKIEAGYGIFEDERLITFVDRQEDYAGLVETVITVNTKLEIKRIKAEMAVIKGRVMKHGYRATKYDMYTLSCLGSNLHFLRNYNA